jgi:hypothetical protein
MVTPLGERMLRAKELEHERIQSEIRKNDAEAKKIEAETKKLDEPLLSKRNIIIYIFSVIKYSIAGVILSCLLFAFALDTGKNLYEITSNKIKENKENQKRISRENEILKNEKEKLQKEYIWLETQTKALEKERDKLQISIQRLRQIEGYGR